MASTFRITVNAQPEVDETFTVEARIGPTVIQTLIITFKAARSGLGECTIGSSIRATLNNLDLVIQSDYNTALLYGILYPVVGDYFVVSALNPEIDFYLIENTADPDVAIDIVNDSTTFFVIDSVVAAEATAGSSCFNVKFTVTCNEQADSITSPIAGAVGANPYIFETERVYGGFYIRMVKDGVVASKRVLCPNLFAEYFELDVFVDPLGVATLNIIPEPFIFTDSTPGVLAALTLEYNIDGGDWQASQTFPGLTEGDYTLNIRDGLGCSISIDFSVDEFNPNLVDFEPEAEISNINPIRYKKVETWSDANPRNVENTLSFEEDTELPNKYYMQPFTKDDSAIKTQVKTNYDSVEAVLIDCDNVETALPVSKVTSNMNIADLRQGTIVSIPYLGNNYVGIRYGSGITYDPDTTVENGTYNLGENLPTWVNVDDYLNIQGVGWSRVLALEYYEGFYTAVVNLLVTGISIPLGQYQIRSVYNSVNFERYEFPVDFSILPEGHYRVRVDVTDSDYDDVQFLSEYLNVRKEHPGTHKVEYYNTDANEILYATGISFTIRMPYVLNLRWKPNTQQDIYVTDTNTVPLDNRYRKQYDINLRPVPTAMADKYALVLLQDRLKVDGLSLVTEGNPDSEPRGSQYQVKATLTEADYVFDSNNSNVGEIVLVEGEPLELDDNASGLLYVN